MFRIGEFSGLVRVSPRMLRHYDKCGLLRPAATDPLTGYRLYGAEQIPALGRIVSLRDAGFGVEEIAALLPHYDDAAAMSEALSRKSAEIREDIADRTRRLEHIAALRGTLDKERVNMIYEVELKALPAVKVFSLRETIDSYDNEKDLWHKLGSYMAHNGISCPECGGYSIYHDEDRADGKVDVEVAIPVTALGQDRDGFTYRELAAIPLSATIRFKGPYEQTAAATEKLASWVEQSGYAMAGLIRSQSIASPQDVKSPDDYLTEIQMPVAKA